MNNGPYGIQPQGCRTGIDKTPASQYFRTIDADGLCSEQRLMLAVLIDAINILKGRVQTGGLEQAPGICRSGALGCH
jgi:hypothetical protein